VSEGALAVFCAIARVPGRFQPTLAALLNRFRGSSGVMLLQVRRGFGCPYADVHTSVYTCKQRLYVALARSCCTADCCLTRLPLLPVHSSQHGGAQVIRQLCAVLGAEAVFVGLADALWQERDLAFASTMVQVSST
jgi:hypothetical protein